MTHASDERASAQLSPSTRAPPRVRCYVRVSQPRSRSIILALWLMVFTISSQVNVVIPILPRLGESLDIPESLFGFVVSVYAIALSVVALLGGPMSDTLGRRRIMLMGCVGTAAALSLHSLAYDFLSLVLARVLTGAAGGFLSGSAVACIGDYFAPERRGRVTGYVLSGVAFGQMIGIPIGTLLAEHFDYRWTFALFAALMVLAATLVWRYLPRIAPPQRPGGLALRAVLANYRRIQRRPGAVLLVATNLIAFAALNVYLVYLPAWLKSHLGLSGTEIASMFFAGGLATVLASPVIGHLTDHVGKVTLIASACAAMGLLAMATLFAVEGTWSASLMFSAMMLAVALRNVPFQSLLTMMVSGRERGTLSSLAFSAGQIGMGVGGLLAGLAYHGYGFAGTCSTAAVLGLTLALLVYQWLPEPVATPTPRERSLPVSTPSPT
ncbi:MFS transporter [Haliangium sp.]|uniref:MFS transporter n=1 Tax=Haliangium sp. TaxID=2663208 RepID=UPI003D0B057A